MQGHHNHSHHGHGHGHHHGHHHHGHHNNHHNPETKIIIIDKAGSNPPMNKPQMAPHTNNSYSVQNAQTTQSSVFDLHPNQEYMFLSGLGHDLVLDVSGDPKAAHQVIVWKKHGQKNQKFRVQPDKNHAGYYHICSVGNNNIISSSNNSKNNGENLYTNPNQSLQGQSWKFEKAKGGQNNFYIKNGYDKYLDVYQGLAVKGTAVIQWDYNGDKNQIWQIVAV